MSAPESPDGVRTPRELEHDRGEPVGPTPPMDFWAALYGRRSVRRFERTPVPRELLDQMLHAGIWAPSSCNYQMWDVVVVDDTALNAKLAALSTQMGDAPVNVVVAYAREFSERGLANVQSASAMIENMSLAAHVLGLGTFWITELGDAEKVRELVGLPRDRMVVAVLAVGYAHDAPKRGPKRRPLSVVAHWNHYAGKPIPSSTRPSDWSPDELAAYQRARVYSGLRHNKERPWEARAIEAMLARFMKSDGGEATKRWLDVLPCNGIWTARMSRERRAFQFDVVERTQDVAELVAARTRPQAGTFTWPDGEAPSERAYDVVTCLFRFENLAPQDRSRLMGSIAGWLAPNGRAIVGFVNARSFHSLTERWRARRGGFGGVEYLLAPEPNIGPFEALDWAEIEKLAREAGLAVADRLGVQPAPELDELDFRTRNFTPRSRAFARSLVRVARLVERVPGAAPRWGRFQFIALERRA